MRSMLYKKCISHSGNTQSFEFPKPHIDGNIVVTLMQWILKRGEESGKKMFFFLASHKCATRKSLVEKFYPYDKTNNTYRTITANIKKINTLVGNIPLIQEGNIESIDRSSDNVHSNALTDTSVVIFVGNLYKDQLEFLYQ